MNDEAFKELIAGMITRGDSVNKIEEVKKRYAASGFKGVAEYNLEHTVLDSNVTVTMDLLNDFLTLGKKDKALTFLEKAYNDRSFLCVLMKVEPIFDDLRTEPRFIALMKKMGFEK